MARHVACVISALCVLVLHASVASAISVQHSVQATTLSGEDIALLVATGELTAQGPWSTERDCPRFCDNACQCLVQQVRKTCEGECNSCLGAGVPCGLKPVNATALKGRLITPVTLIRPVQSGSRFKQQMHGRRPSIFVHRHRFQSGSASEESSESSESSNSTESSESSRSRSRSESSLQQRSESGSRSSESSARSESGSRSSSSESGSSSSHSSSSSSRSGSSGSSSERSAESSSSFGSSGSSESSANGRGSASSTGASTYQTDYSKTMPGASSKSSTAPQPRSSLSSEESSSSSSSSSEHGNPTHIPLSTDSKLAPLHSADAHAIKEQNSKISRILDLQEEIVQLLKAKAPHHAHGASDLLSQTLLRQQDTIREQLGSLLAGKPLRTLSASMHVNKASRAATLESLVKHLEQLVAWVRVRKMQSSDKNGAEAELNRLLERAKEIMSDS